MRKFLVIANWKMNPQTQREARMLFAASANAASRARNVEVALAPPVPFLGLFAGQRRRIALASQDLFWETKGAFTGAISPAALSDLGVRYVIIGHSERRRVFHEDDQMVNWKIRAAFRFGLIPVVAVGEDEAESGAVVPPKLARQLEGALVGIPRRFFRNAVFAYEPVWAIGSGTPETPDNATRRAIYIRKLLVMKLGREIAESIRVLYGGSVTSKNAATFITQDIRGMDGLLIGGASLHANEFASILREVAALKRVRS